MPLQTAPLPPIHPRPEFAGILRDRELFGSWDQDTSSDRLNRWFDTLMIQSGLPLAPSLVLFLCVCAAVTFGGAAFVVQENLLTTAVGTLFGLMLPIAVAMLARSRRQKQIVAQLPGMLDELARAARTGRSIEQCLELVAQDTANPLGAELRIGTRRLQMGLTVKEALQDLPYRTGLINLNLLVMTLAVHQQTGGDLVTVLERLARTIRDRLLYLGRLKAATSASRATAILMIALPPAVLAFFMVRDPEYFTLLMNSAWGRTATLLALALEVVGTAWVLRILRSSQQA